MYVQSKPGLGSKFMNFIRGYLRSHENHRIPLMKRWKWLGAVRLEAISRVNIHLINAAILSNNQEEKIHFFLDVNFWLSCQFINSFPHGPLARYIKLGVAHASWIPGTFSPSSRVSDPDMHHRTCVTHVSWCMPWSLTSRNVLNSSIVL